MSTNLSGSQLQMQIALLNLANLLKQIQMSKNSYQNTQNVQPDLTTHPECNGMHPDDVTRERRGGWENHHQYRYSRATFRRRSYYLSDIYGPNYDIEYKFSNDTYRRRSHSPTHHQRIFPRDFHKRTNLPDRNDFKPRRKINKKNTSSANANIDQSKNATVQAYEKNSIPTICNKTYESNSTSNVNDNELSNSLSPKDNIQSCLYTSEEEKGDSQINQQVSDTQHDTTNKTETESLNGSTIDANETAIDIEMALNKMMNPVSVESIEKNKSYLDPYPFIDNFKMVDMDLASSSSSTEAIRTPELVEQLKGAIEVKEISKENQSALLIKQKSSVSRKKSVPSKYPGSTRSSSERCKERRKECNAGNPTDSKKRRISFEDGHNQQSKIKERRVSFADESKMRGKSPVVEKKNVYFPNLNPNYKIPKKPQQFSKFDKPFMSTISRLFGECSDSEDTIIETAEDTIIQSSTENNKHSSDTIILASNKKNKHSNDTITQSYEKNKYRSKKKTYIKTLEKQNVPIKNNKSLTNIIEVKLTDVVKNSKEHLPVQSKNHTEPINKDDTSFKLDECTTISKINNVPKNRTEKQIGKRTKRSKSISNLFEIENQENKKFKTFNEKETDSTASNHVSKEMSKKERFENEVGSYVDEKESKNKIETNPAASNHISEEMPRKEYFESENKSCTEDPNKQIKKIETTQKTQKQIDLVPNLQKVENAIAKDIEKEKQINLDSPTKKVPNKQIKKIETTQKTQKQIDLNPNLQKVENAITKDIEKEKQINIDSPKKKVPNKQIKKIETTQKTQKQIDLDPNLQKVENAIRKDIEKEKQIIIDCLMKISNKQIKKIETTQKTQNQIDLDPNLQKVENAIAKDIEKEKQINLDSPTKKVPNKQIKKIETTQKTQKQIDLNPNHQKVQNAITKDIEKEKQINIDSPRKKVPNKQIKKIETTQKTQKQIDLDPNLQKVENAITKDIEKEKQIIIDCLMKISNKQIKKIETTQKQNAIDPNLQKVEDEIAKETEKEKQIIVHWNLLHQAGTLQKSAQSTDTGIPVELKKMGTSPNPISDKSNKIEKYVSTINNKDSNSSKLVNSVTVQNEEIPAAVSKEIMDRSIIDINAEIKQETPTADFTIEQIHTAVKSELHELEKASTLILEPYPPLQKLKIFADDRDCVEEAVIMERPEVHTEIKVINQKCASVTKVIEIESDSEDIIYDKDDKVQIIDLTVFDDNTDNNEKITLYRSGETENDIDEVQAMSAHLPSTVLEPAKQVVKLEVAVKLEGENNDANTSENFEVSDITTAAVDTQSSRYVELTYSSLNVQNVSIKAKEPTNINQIPIITGPTQPSLEGISRNPNLEVNQPASKININKDNFVSQNNCTSKGVENQVQSMSISSTSHKLLKVLGNSLLTNLEKDTCNKKITSTHYNLEGSYISSPPQLERISLPSTNLFSNLDATDSLRKTTSNINVVCNAPNYQKNIERVGQAVSETRSFTNLQNFNKNSNSLTHLVADSLPERNLRNEIVNQANYRICETYPTAIPAFSCSNSLGSQGNVVVDNDRIPSQAGVHVQNVRPNTTSDYSRNQQSLPPSQQYSQNWHQSVAEFVFLAIQNSLLSQEFLNWLKSKNLTGLGYNVERELSLKIECFRLKTISYKLVSLLKSTNIQPADCIPENAIERIHHYLQLLGTGALSQMYVTLNSIMTASEDFYLYHPQLRTFYQWVKGTANAISAKANLKSSTRPILSSEQLARLNWQIEFCNKITKSIQTAKIIQNSRISTNSINPHSTPIFKRFIQNGNLHKLMTVCGAPADFSRLRPHVNANQVASNMGREQVRQITPQFSVPNTRIINNSNNQHQMVYGTMRQPLNLNPFPQVSRTPARHVEIPTQNSPELFKIPSQISQLRRVRKKSTDSLSKSPVNVTPAHSSRQNSPSVTPCSETVNTAMPSMIQIKHVYAPVPFTRNYLTENEFNSTRLTSPVISPIASTTNNEVTSNPSINASPSNSTPSHQPASRNCESPPNQPVISKPTRDAPLVNESCRNESNINPSSSSDSRHVLDEGDSTVDAQFSESEIPNNDVNIKTEDKRLNKDDETIFIDLTWLDDVDTEDLKKELDFIKKEELEQEEEVILNKEQFPVAFSPNDSGIENSPSPQVEQNESVYHGRLCICEKRAEYICVCRMVMYCSDSCQRLDWVQHKRICLKALSKQTD